MDLKEAANMDVKYGQSSPNSVEPSDTRLDKHGLPLVPQPSSSKMDPLNWKPWLKMVVLIQVSLIAFTSLLVASLITPAFRPLAKFLHKDLVQTAYVTSVFIICVGVSPLVFNPIANVYGRRPLYIMSVLLSIATSAASGASHDYGELLTFRALNGFFGGIPQGLGSATVSDMYFEHERGLYMGVYTVFLINGGHIAPIIGGYITKNLSWHWCFYVAACISSFLVVFFIFTVPETLFSRSEEALDRPSRTWAQNMTMRGKIHPTRKLRPIDFFRPLQMLKYPSVLLPALYYAVSFGYGSILFVITASNLFGEAYHFKPYQTGLLLGIPLTVGTILGEIISGGFSDWITERRAVANGGVRRPEDRLFALFPAFVLTPVGIIIEGVCIEKKLHWAGTGMGIGIASFGLQVASTIVYTYTAECYKAQSAEIGAVLNMGRQFFSFAIGFYAIPLGKRVGFQDAWIIFAMIDIAFCFPLIPLMLKGDKWRKAMGPVTFHPDL